MKYIHTIVIGAGQAGLALSRCLTDRGIEHVVLERGRVAQRWSERWDSLRLLSPNWMTRLPGWQYRGADPNGFMERDEVRRFLREYARSFDAPVEEHTQVQFVVPWTDGWLVMTDRGMWRARNVVIAAGHCHRARVPGCAADLSRDVAQISTDEYRNPAQVREGGVLVVGASATGVQLARELHRAGHPVTLSVGKHVRLPRRYRGRDIHYWLDRTGILERPICDMPDAEAARREPSLQLVGGSETLDLEVLSKQGIRLTGRVAGFDGTTVHFADDLAATTGDAERRMRRVLAKVDAHIASHGANRHFPAEPSASAIDIAGAPDRLDLRAEGIGTVLWATGYRRTWRWLHAPVFDAEGEIRHHRGRTAARGLYVLGLQFMTRRNSSFIDGVGRDAEEIATEIARPSRLRQEAA